MTNYTELETENYKVNKILEDTLLEGFTIPPINF